MRYRIGDHQYLRPRPPAGRLRLGTCARQLVKEMAGIKSVDVVVPVRRAEITTELRLRVVTTPEPALAQLLAHLGLRLPKGTREVSNVVPKISP